ncbi:hypothetical protein QS306_10065 [Paraburkholderia bonniea]|uniref:hypothetical protein n=1 Tax=Paraburkholderia bonniea TaxID=2152891 RepID=UPI002572A226|nr:hypothetical protein [Paraburkholderia bonniea]WJF89464.1 hypothetical protein QS306_10065 [Paraburkholderia bonniea]WJF92779.1 hypothetical protein QS308_10075 [Paraburkholderia bonniea]
MIRAITPLFPLDKLASFSIEDRRTYLRRLWNADIDPMLFRDIARRLGYVVRCHWDCRHDMPTLSPISGCAVTGEVHDAHAITPQTGSRRISAFKNR